MTIGSERNLKALLEHGLLPLTNNLPEITSWNYTPSTDNKSTLGFLGIKNLSNICYMIAMLQQFYNTPAFRYAILAADDYKEENEVEFNNKKYDDNLFHQLQKMFAY